MNKMTYGIKITQTILNKIRCCQHEFDRGLVLSYSSKPALVLLEHEEWANPGNIIPILKDS